MKHYLRHTVIGLCALCDDEPRPVKELTSNEGQVTCDDCWKLLTQVRVERPNVKPTNEYKKAVDEFMDAVKAFDAELAKQG